MDQTHKDKEKDKEWTLEDKEKDEDLKSVLKDSSVLKDKDEDKD